MLLPENPLKSADFTGTSRGAPALIYDFWVAKVGLGNLKNSILVIHFWDILHMNLCSCVRKNTRRFADFD